MLTMFHRQLRVLLPMTSKLRVLLPITSKLRVLLPMTSNSLNVYMYYKKKS
jgi:hypothetical protein